MGIAEVVARKPEEGHTDLLQGDRSPVAVVEIAEDVAEKLLVAAHTFEGTKHMLHCSEDH